MKRMEPESKPDPSHWQHVERHLKRRGISNPNTLEMYRRASFYLDGYDPAKLTQAEADRIRERIMGERQGNGQRLMIIGVKSILKRVYGRPELVMKAPRHRNRVKDVLEVGDVQRILDTFRDDKLRAAAFETLYGSVLRRGELTRLNVEDFNLAEREVLIRDAKTGDRVVNLTPQAVVALEKWFKARPSYRDAQGQAAFVSDATGRRIDRRFVIYNLAKAAVEAGVRKRIYPHLLRASGITHLLNEGVNPATVQQQAGHHNFQTTMIYNRPTRGDNRKHLETAWNRLAATDRKPRGPEDAVREIAQAFGRGELSLGDFQKMLSVLEATNKNPGFLPPDVGFA